MSSSAPPPTPRRWRPLLPCAWRLLVRGVRFHPSSDSLRLPQLPPASRGCSVGMVERSPKCLHAVPNTLVIVLGGSLQVIQHSGQDRMGMQAKIASAGDGIGCLEARQRSTFRRNSSEVRIWKDLFCSRGICLVGHVLTLSNGTVERGRSCWPWWRSYWLPKIQPRRRAITNAIAARR